MDAEPSSPHDASETSLPGSVRRLEHLTFEELMEYCRTMPGLHGSHIPQMYTQQREPVYSYIKVVDADATTGVKSCPGRSRGGQRRREKFKKIHAEWQQAAEDIWRRNSSLPKTVVARRVATQFDKSKDTVYKKIRKPR